MTSYKYIVSIFSKEIIFPLSPAIGPWLSVIYQFSQSLADKSNSITRTAGGWMERSC